MIYLTHVFPKHALTHPQADLLICGRVQVWGERGKGEEIRREEKGKEGKGRDGKEREEEEWGG